MRLILFKRKECSNCPAAMKIVEEVSRDVVGLDVSIVDVDEMDESLNYELLEQQIYIFSTPTIVIGNGETLKVFSSGILPDVKALQMAIGG